MVERPPLDDFALRNVEDVFYGVFRRVPPYASLLTSPLVRKLASLSLCGTYITLEDISLDLQSTLDASLPGSRDLARWLHSLDFLCSTPTANELSLACHAGMMRDLKQAVAFLPPPSGLWCRVDDAPARDILDRAAHSLAGVSALERSDVEAIDYPALLPVLPTAAPWEEHAHPAELSWVNPAVVIETLNELACFVDNRQHGEQLHATGNEVQARALHLLSRSPQGARATLCDWLPKSLEATSSMMPRMLFRSVLRAALRTLYAVECQVGAAASAALLDIKVLGILHEAAAQARGNKTSLLPLQPREVNCLVLANAPPSTPWPCPLSDVEELRAEILSRVPWLEAVKGDFCVTGSLLTESIVHHGSRRVEDAVGDTDIFCFSEAELPALVASVEEALGLGSSARRVSSRRWIVTSLCQTRTVDVYANSLESVCGYHLPLVRCAFSWLRRKLYLFPSCAMALAWGINIDIQGFVGASQKNPFDVIDRKMLAGFSFVLTPKEFYQVQTYIFIMRSFRISRVGLSRLT
jgi:hypothetical protein